MQASVDELIGKLTLDEKISLLAGADLWHTAAIPRLKIPAIKVTDGPNGARGAWNNLSPASSLIPVGIALGATWNPDLVEKIGVLLADEVKTKGAHILLAPTVNIHRTPIAGRNFECYSEDPFLSATMATAYIRGIQGNGAGACIKHFVCNDQEFERTSISANVEERPMHEIYLEPFRRAIRDADPWVVMSAYNKVNGVNASENDYTLKTVLKEKWDFDGLVMSDWYGTYTKDVADGGLDLEMPGPAHWMSAEYVKAALVSGRLTMKELDNKVRRVLWTVERSGASDNLGSKEEGSHDTPEVRALIREAARETIVLLSNKNDLLPLNPAKVRSVAVIGELARWPNVMGGGSSHVNPPYVISPLDGIRTRLGESVMVEYEVGCFVHKSIPVLKGEDLVSEDGRAGLNLHIYDNLDFSGEPAYEQVTDCCELGWFDNSVPNVNPERFCLRLTGMFTAQESGRHIFGLSSFGQGRLFLDEKLMIDNWDSYVPDEEKTADVDLKAGQEVALKVEFRWDGNRVWRMIRVGHLPPLSADLMADAVALAKHSDAVILVAGLTSEWEAEGFDRVDMELPGRQDELIEKICVANPNTVVVLNAGSALSMPWIEQAGAVVEQWYNSQECGNALADILFGDVSPSGKLPTTFPVRLEDNPAFINYPGENGQVLYGEGIFVGYRYYDTKQAQPLFPFGHGLSYTTFDYSDLQLSSHEFTEAEGLNVSLKVRNTGKYPAMEIVQVYVSDAESALVRPKKELKAFAKVELVPGEQRTLAFHLDREAFWYYNPAKGGWTVEPGEFEILVGASSRDVRLRARSSLVSTSAEPRLNSRMTLAAVLQDEAGKAVLAKHFGDWLSTYDVNMSLNTTVEQALRRMHGDVVTPEEFQALERDLSEV